MNGCLKKHEITSTRERHLGKLWVAFKLYNTKWQRWKQALQFVEPLWISVLNYLIKSKDKSIIGLALTVFCVSRWAKRAKPVINLITVFLFFHYSLLSSDIIRFSLGERRPRLGRNWFFFLSQYQSYNWFVFDKRQLDNAQASMAKYYASDLENKVAYDCLQLHGGWGFMMETPIAR